MFLIMITYIKPIEEIDRHLAEHRAFLEKGYQNNIFVVSGPRNPRTGGVIISQLTDRHQLEAILAGDPFLINEVAQYEVIEFMPVKYHKDFANFVESKGHVRDL